MFQIEKSVNESLAGEGNELELFIRLKKILLREKRLKTLSKTEKEIELSRTDTDNYLLLSIKKCSYQHVLYGRYFN